MALYQPPPDLTSISAPGDDRKDAGYNGLGIDMANISISCGSISTSNEIMMWSSRRCSMIGCNGDQGIVKIEHCYNLHVIGSYNFPVVDDDRLRYKDHRLYVFCEFLRSSGDIRAYNLSDIRLKKNISSMNNCLNDLLKIRCVNFNWKNRNGDKDIGLLAQEVEAIRPEVVKTRKNGMKAMSYKKMTAVIVGAIQDQNKQIIRIQKKIERLKYGRQV